jgi:tetratricopeptide (TPR) repeat protein
LDTCLASLQEEAVEATEEAISIYRRLVEAQPQEFLPELARSLHNLGIHLHELGQRERALAATEKAETILRELATKVPEAPQ